ncbi:MAG: hypothetical protein PHU50_06750, partial [Kiritimatiellae bacterium]|nr:hypothetical protein [Kiritimatiellia bacterium]
KTDQIKAKIIQQVVHDRAGDDHADFAISGRHHKALLIDLEEIKKAENCLNTGSEADFLPAATHSRAALEQIGLIFGKNCPEEMLDAIFSRFCVGK